MTLSTKENIAFGLSREEHNHHIIEEVFGLKLVHTKYRFANYDWYDANKNIVVEHKSFSRQFHKSNFCLLKTNKVLNSNSIFIFEFDTSRTFYLQYSGKIFKEFQQDWVRYSGKILKEHFFIIPNSYLIEFTPSSKIDLTFKNKNIPYIKMLIEQDKEKSKLYNH